MARPIKQGLDYFPLNVDIDQDDKFQLIEALHGITGFGITIKLLMRIYREGYYYDWTEMEQILFAKRVNVDINTVQEVVNDCIKYKIFDKGMFDAHEILTSKGIQSRYFEAVTRRKSVDAEDSYILVNIENYPNVNKMIVNVDINPKSVEVNDDISTQRKGKERKGEESKELPAEEKIPFAEIVNYLNDIASKKYRSVESTKKHIRARWNEGHRLDDFKSVIDIKCNEWIGDKQMQKYIRPETLFGTKFESYLNQGGSTSKTGSSVDWDNL